MSWQQDIINQLTSIQTWIDNVQANVKNLLNFPTASSLNGEDYLKISQEGVDKKVSLTTVLSYLSINTLFVENRYADISSTNELLDDQSNQTEGKIQFVLDATDDPNVDSGYAYYEKLDTNNASLLDYRKLTQEEVTAIETYTPLFVDIDGYAVRKTPLFLTVDAWEVGDTFQGWPSTSRYVVGKVVGLPFDVDDESKTKLVIDNTIF